MIICEYSDYSTLIFADAEQAESEHPDFELIWNIHLLSQVWSKF